MNIVHQFAEALQDQFSIATLGTDLFIGEAPSSNKVPDSIWWIISAGGANELSALSGERQVGYLIEIFHRGRDYGSVYDNLYDLESQISCNGCFSLDGLEVVALESQVLPIDQDIDGENRKVGVLQVKLTIYKEC